jgi:hypothetical protein
MRSEGRLRPIIARWARERERSCERERVDGSSTRPFDKLRAPSEVEGLTLAATFSETALSAPIRSDERLIDLRDLRGLRVRHLEFGSCNHGLR